MTAEPELITHFTQLTNDFDDRVECDRIVAFYFGRRFLIEVEIIVSEHMKVKTSHDLGIQLQKQIELDPRVERAFVHVDYQKRLHSEHSEKSHRV